MAEKKQFEVLDTPLEGSNLIEASAGTGKTYSIAILVLRLLLEKKVDISRILMVTFTNKAVGELADRVRKFIKKGLDYSEKREVEIESEIATIINRSINKEGNENVEKLLKAALFKLDEAPIQTIDSFAGECLNTYAFETGRQFGQELIKDHSDIVRACVEKFWREEITDINDEEYDEVKSYLTLDMFQKIVFNILDGKEFYYGDEACKTIEEEDKEFRKIWEENLEKYHQRIDGLDVKLKGVGPATIASVKEEFLELYKFKECIQLKRTKAYNKLINYLFQEEIKFYRDWQTEWNHPAHEIFNSCAKAVVSEVENYLEENNLITYKQILDKLNEKVKSNSQLRKILSDRYDAVFIDEFQDTNKTQFEIYDHAFGEKNLLFYIGDPKQSIYGFRGADLFSYDEAAKTVDVIYTMKENFRSSHKMVEAQNSFFRPKKDFDAFNTNARVNEEDDVLDIKYIPVSAKGENKAAVGIEDNKGNILAPIKIFNGENSGSIPEHTVDLIKNLLSESFSLNGEEIQASNIGILVRKGWQGEMIRRRLSAEGIRAITVNETTIFSTPEAKSVNYLLKAVETPTWGNINRVMLTEFTSLKTQDLLDLDENSLAEDFRKYKDLWINSGVYAVIRKFMDDYGVVHNLMSGDNENGLRHLSNINQLAEVLQQAELHRELGPSGLIKYLSRQISSPDAEGDEYEQRIESDEDAVRIYNIHKAKGLEFPIVIAPYLDLDNEKEYQFNSFRDPADKKYKFYHKELRPDVARKHYVLQNTQENRRLIYVTLTRAQFNCFIFKTGRNSSLSSFVEELKEHSDPLLLEFSPFDLPSEAVPRTNGDEKELERKALASQGTYLKDRDWRKMSFSAISAKGAKSSKENTDRKMEGYEEFIFRKMPGGTRMGNLLHEIFENIDFQDPDGQVDHLKDLAGDYYPEKKEVLNLYLPTLVREVLSARIDFGQSEGEVNLSQIAEADKICELEFDFLSRPFKLSQLRDIPELNDFKIYNKKWNFSPEGMLTGFVDLLFKQNGKFYILDWKSNYLGGSLEQYRKEHLITAMNENNYHLQYFIYTVAVKRFLESRLGSNFDYNRDFGGVIYMFLRGNRGGKQTGVFTTKPSFEQVQYLEKLFFNEGDEKGNGLEPSTEQNPLTSHI